MYTTLFRNYSLTRVHSFLGVLTLLRLLFLLVLHVLSGPLCRRCHPCLIPVRGYPGPVTQGRRSRRGSRPSRGPEGECPISPRARAWGGSPGWLFEPSRGRRCRVPQRTQGPGRGESRADKARAKSRLLSHNPSFFQSLSHLTKLSTQPTVSSRCDACVT